MVKRIILPVLSILSLSSVVSALDEYMPIPLRIMEISVGFERSTIPGHYDASWESVDAENPNNPTAIPLQGKFGLLENMEGSIAVDYLAKDADGQRGFDRPVLALKYADPVLGLGGFMSITLPVGFEDIVTEQPYATLTFGTIYGKDFKHVKLLGNLSYAFNTEDVNERKEDFIRLFLKPEYPVSIPALVQRKQYLGINLGMQYDFFFNRMEEGQSTGVGGDLFAVSPGVYYAFNKIIALEIGAPVTLSGQNKDRSYGAHGKLRFSLDENIYNAL